MACVRLRACWIIGLCLYTCTVLTRFTVNATTRSPALHRKDVTPGMHRVEIWGMQGKGCLQVHVKYANTVHHVMVRMREGTRYSARLVKNVELPLAVAGGRNRRCIA